MFSRVWTRFASLGFIARPSAGLTLPSRLLCATPRIMSGRVVVQTDAAPTPIGPYSQAVRHGNTLYCSGSIGVNPATRQLVSDQAGEQAHQAFSNLKAVIEAAGATMDQVVKVNIFITDFANFAAINEVMKQFFTAPYPARSTVAVAGLPLNCLVEVEAIVGLGESQPRSKF